MLERKDQRNNGDVVHLSAGAHRLITTEASKYKISNKEFVEFCTSFCSALDLDPTNDKSLKNKSAAKKIATIKLFKELEKNMIDRFSESRNIYISFIKQMEKEELIPIKTRLTSLENQLKLETKNLALNNIKSTVILIDLITDILIDKPKDKKLFFEKFAAKLK